MQQALAWAERGRGAVEPNPLVGAVVVRAGQLVGAGYHERFGQAHAEVNALAAAGEQARGATLYVTLEPCCHFGKTPPCTRAVLAAGIARVVAALRDPFPPVAGQGVAELQAAGVVVEIGLLAADAVRQNAAYLTRLTRGRPYVTAKWAMTLDGKIATHTGHSQWISGLAARARVHEWRGQADAILVGAGTVRADNPQLTARPPGPRVATRVVLTQSGQLAPTGHLFQTAREVPVLLATAGAVDRAWERAGAEILPLRDLPTLFAEFGRRRWTNVFVEGGAGVLGALRAAGLIDAVRVLIAPLLVGGQAAPGPIGEPGADTLDLGTALVDTTVERIGADVLFSGSVRGAGPLLTAEG